MECFTADFLWLVFTSLKMSWNPKNDQFLDKKKGKSLHKYCPAATGTVILDAKVQNSVFWKI